MSLRSASAPPYVLTLPAERRGSVIFDSPHSGRAYPAEFLRRSQLDARAIRSSEDAFIDMLLEPAPALGAPLLAALTPRAYVDFNRSAEELDPALIEGVRAGGHNPRIASGLGVIPRVVAGGRAIQPGKIARIEAEARIERHWRPYHAALARLVATARAETGQAILFDMHSMPHEAADSTAAWRRRPDVVLGDRFGTTASAAITDRVEAAFLAEGLNVARNAPFAGAYIVQSYGRPSEGRHAVQIEIDRALYMNERTVEPHAGFEVFRALMARVVAALVAIGDRNALPLAAE